MVPIDLFSKHSQYPTVSSMLTVNGSPLENHLLTVITRTSYVLLLKFPCNSSITWIFRTRKSDDTLTPWL